MTSNAEPAPRLEAIVEIDTAAPSDIDPAAHPDWLTYSEAADLTGKSTKTIARAVNVTKGVRGLLHDGRKYVSVTDMIAAGMLSASRAVEAGSPRDAVELHRMRETTVALREQLATASATLHARESEIERVVTQLREKDSQIARLIKIVEQHAVRGGHR